MWASLLAHNKGNTFSSKLGYSLQGPVVQKPIKTDSVQSSSNTCKNYLLKIYSQHGNFLNAI